jgi:anthranilate/para-aminobenzoate synthase component II
MHGRASRITHDERRLFANLPSPLTVGRYHSLVIDQASLPTELQVTARASDGVIMAIEHRSQPVWGVQFHPESILSVGGFMLLANFLTMAGLQIERLPDMAGEHPPSIDDYVLPTRPVTF